MFNLFHRRTIPAAILTSKLYNESHFYAALTYDSKRAKREVLIESPYLTCRRTTELLPILATLVHQGVKVSINTRNPYHHEEYMRIQAWMALPQLRAAGIKVKTCNDYRHRKLAVIDGKILWEGSLNIFLKIPAAKLCAARSQKSFADR